MGRRLIIGGQGASNRLSTTGRSGARSTGTAPRQASRSRSLRYRELARSLDTGEVREAGALQQLLADIRAELGEAGLVEMPAGMVAECFLGPPYRVHTLDLVGQIVEHYEAGRAMAQRFERARSLALHPAYVVVEVYSDHLVAIRADGTATKV